MFLRCVNLLNHRVNIFIEADIFVMPANLKIQGRVISKWLKFHLKEIFMAASYSKHFKKWTLHVNPLDIDFLNQYLPFSISELFLELQCTNCQLTIFIRF